MKKKLDIVTPVAPPESADAIASLSININVAFHGMNSPCGMDESESRYMRSSVICDSKAWFKELIVQTMELAANEYGLDRDYMVGELKKIQQHLKK